MFHKIVLVGVYAARDGEHNNKDGKDEGQWCKDEVDENSRYSTKKAESYKVTEARCYGRCNIVLLIVNIMKT